MAKGRVRRIVSALLCVASAFSTAAFFSGCNTNKGLVIWTFTNEISNMYNKYYKEFDPDTKITIREVGFENFSMLLDNAISTKKNVPDIIALEEKLMRSYIDDNLLLSLDDIVGEKTKNMYNYTLNAAKNAAGNVAGLSWQATPGAFYYRYDIAEDVWGDGSPEFVQNKVKDWESFIQTAKELKNFSVQKDYRILSAVASPLRIFLSQRENPWVVDNKLVIDSTLLEDPNYNALDVMYKLQMGRLLEPDYESDGREPHYINEQTETKEGWYTDMSGNKVFGYILSSWGLHHDLKPNAISSDGLNDTSGQWRVITGPGKYSDGGTWLSILKSSKNADKAKKFIEYITTNEEFLRAYSAETGDFLNHQALMTEIAESDFADPFLGGQNQYQVLNTVAKEISGNKITRYDSNINEFFSSWAIKYAMSTVSKDAALAGFKDSIRSYLPSLIIE